MSEETLFLEALAQPDAAQRAEYLDRVCPDALQRRKIDELLAAHGNSNLLDRPMLDLGRTGAYVPATEIRESTAAVGDRVGPYKLLEKIGEGGMGEVWVADQLAPIKRRVAIKLIKPGMDSRSVLGRFEAERQALAVMDHPNISKVLDAGTTTDGRPYFVMELVKGTSITEFCDARKLTPKQRLELFIPVCHAIQHAHMKGIIHRDIKPGNVLVALHDEMPVPKVIDFGVAKAVGQQLTDKTIYTGFGALVGTPTYMAPEQATFNQLDVDTRADVYALGVLLYELLVGSPPIEKERLKLAALDEVLRIVRDEEPPRPSQRLSTSQARATIAATRGSEPVKLSQLMKGELDWIVMKALEKDRTRRYETANGFAADVLRYLSGEAVLAVPPSTAYRLKKFSRKNRAALTTAAAIALLLVAGAAISTWQAVRATKAEVAARAAEQDAVAARKNEETERKTAVAERDAKKKALADERMSKKEEQRQRLVTAEVLRFFTERVLAAARPKAAGGMGRSVTVLTALGAAERHLGEEFVTKPAIEGRLRMSLGETYAQLGRYDLAEKQFRRAAEIFAPLPDHDDEMSDAIHAIVWVLLERGGEQRRPETVVQLLGANGAQGVEVALTELIAKGRRGEPDYFQARTLVARGDLRFRLGRYRQAEADFRECSELLDRIDREDWILWYSQAAAGACLLRQKRYSEAEPLMLAGYSGMKEREPEIPKDDKALLAEGVDRLIEFYTATNKPDDVKKWRAERARYARELAPLPREKK